MGSTLPISENIYSVLSDLPIHESHSHVLGGLGLRGRSSRSVSSSDSSTSATSGTSRSSCRHAYKLRTLEQLVTKLSDRLRVCEGSSPRYTDLSDIESGCFSPSSSTSHSSTLRSASGLSAFSRALLNDTHRSPPLAFRTPVLRPRVCRGAGTSGVPASCQPSTFPEVYEPAINGYSSILATAASLMASTVVCAARHPPDLAFVSVTVASQIVTCATTCALLRIPRYGPLLAVGSGLLMCLAFTDYALSYVYPCDR